MTVDFNAVLGLGEDQAVSMPETAKRLGICERYLRKLIFDARCEGFPIGSSVNGYFILSTDAEQKQFADMQRKRAFSTLRISKIKKSAQIPGQMSLFDTDFDK